MSRYAKDPPWLADLLDGIKIVEVPKWRIERANADSPDCGG